VPGQKDKVSRKLNFPLLPPRRNAAPDCTKTAASGLVEHTKAIERLLLKELGNLAP
jgi:hypothetical protein